MNPRTGIVAGLALLAAGTTAQAALQSRAGGQAYYDTDLDITWVADAMLPRTSGYDGDGLMTWDDAQTWIGTLNSANYLGVNDWRLPETVDTGAIGCDFAYSGTDCGYNVQTKSGSTVYSEMAHLYYVTLDNLGYYDTSGSGPQPGFGLKNTGPFSNVRDDHYWSDTTYAPFPTDVWSFYFGSADYHGYQAEAHKDGTNFAWAVSPGDTVVPVPAAGWLFASALGLMGLRRKARTA